MCPACVGTTAAIIAGTLSTGGVLAVCFGKIKEFFKANSPSLFQKTKEK
jgi:hypothetical protein